MGVPMSRPEPSSALQRQCLPCQLLAHRACAKGECRCQCRTVDTETKSEKAATQQPSQGAGSQ